MAAGVVAVAPSSAEAGGTRATRGARGAPPAHRSHATRGAHRAANQDLVVVGAGEGHGVGMSQWGAYGYARRGWGYAAILSHYYSSTSLGQTSSTRVVRVLLAGNRGSLTFTGATHAGTLALSSGQSYTALRSGTAAVSLRDARGHTLATLAAPLRVTGPGPLTLAGRADNGVSNGAYRGDLELSPGRHGGINAVDAVALEDYVRAASSPRKRMPRGRWRPWRPRRWPPAPMRSPPPWAMVWALISTQTPALNSTAESRGSAHPPIGR